MQAYTLIIYKHEQVSILHGARWTRWTSGSLENGEAVDVKDPAVNKPSQYECVSTSQYVSITPITGITDEGW